ncbi:MAG: PEP-CTERM sorting domain-containing protein [Verrucomicrobia bacterium]|nr:PEP-CTERM sorting domain-containing protein [Verrucomicrobiota bacterium]
MAGYLAEVARVLEAWPQNIELAVIMAGDEPVTLAGPGRLDGAQLTALRERLTRWRTVGGQDNVPALVLAWDFAARQTNSVVLWIHAPQPVMLSTADALRQAFERRKSGPRVLALPVAPGPNRIIEQLEGLPALSAVPRRGTVAEDLRGLLTCWTGQRRGWAFEFVHVDPLPGAVPAGREVSLHAGRLWAAAEVRRLQATRAVAAAVELAASYQIVTPLSGAVVLETQEQYDQHGLEPADPLSVPAIPEPGIRALLLLGLLALGLRRRRK